MLNKPTPCLLMLSHNTMYKVVEFLQELSFLLKSEVSILDYYYMNSNSCKMSQVYCNCSKHAQKYNEENVICKAM